ncbi:MAG: iron-sulfur cluster assembly scaffold protein, partial [Candidatus Rokuibacteriota bacterium]
SAGTEMAAGFTLEDLATVPPAQIEAAVGGLPPERRHAALVVAGALRAAARDALARNGRG